MQHNRRIPIINAKSIGFTIAFAIIGAMLLLTGCGGGGGGPNYPTPTLPAGAVVFDSSNAISMAGEAVSDSGFVGTVAKQGQAVSSVKSVTDMIVTQLVGTQQSSSVVTGATQVVLCTGGGDITATINGNESSASGSFSFNDCIEGTITISGTFAFNGSANNAGDFSFNGGGSITVSDTFDSTSIAMVMNFSESGNVSGTITLSFSFSIDGLPSGGFLVDTTQPFVGTISGVTSGQLTIYGGDGINGNPTRIQININGDGTADVYLDIDDGNGFIFQDSIII